MQSSRMKRSVKNEPLDIDLTNDEALPVLKPEERETLLWLVQGYSIREISELKMNKSVDSINLYIRSAKNKFNAKNRDQLIATVIRLGVLEETYKNS